MPEILTPANILIVCVLSLVFILLANYSLKKMSLTEFTV